MGDRRTGRNRISCVCYHNSARIVSQFFTMEGKICSYDLLEKSPKVHEFQGQIPRVSGDIPYADFYWNFLVKNKPCLISSEEAVKGWNASKKWVTPDRGIDHDYLKKVYGEVEVSVTRIRSDMSMDYGGMECSPMLVKDYLQYLDGSKEESKPCLYLKDWHILRKFGSETDPPYQTLPFFRSDWLNETCEEDDYRFAYIGPKGSWTPFHADVFGSYSWSVNIFGKKRWRLYSPGTERTLFPSGKYDFNSPGRANVDFLEVLQKEGETIFVPSGWHHIVWNQTDAISINHNWFNGANICFIWHQLQAALSEVEKEIGDLRDWDEFPSHCQLILRANHGMDYNDFVELLRKIADKRNYSDQEEFSCHHSSRQEEGFSQSSIDLKVLKHLIEDHVLQDNRVASSIKEKW